jgi:hypothetical protein
VLLAGQHPQNVRVVMALFLLTLVQITCPSSHSEREHGQGNCPVWHLAVQQTHLCPQNYLTTLYLEYVASSLVSPDGDEVIPSSLFCSVAARVSNLSNKLCAVVSEKSAGDACCGVVASAGLSLSGK